MAKLTEGYYHCVECGALFEAAIKDIEEQRCSVCGNRPTGGEFLTEGADELLAKESASVGRESGELLPRASGKLHGVNHDTQDIYEATVATMDAQRESRHGRVKRSKRKKSKGHRRWVFVLVWIVVMAAVIVGVEYFGGGDDDMGSVAQLENAEQDLRMVAAKEKKRGLIIEASIPECEQVMMAFLDATSAAAKAQHVYQGVQLSGVMNRYYRDVIGFSSERSKVKIVRAELLNDFPQRTLGALCLNGEGEKWEAVFLMVGGEWKIDWKAIVRYDDRSWPLFTAGKEGDEGEFRLYVRVRDTNEDFEQKEMSLVFYKPTMFLKGEFRGVASSPVRVLIDSDLGRAMMKVAEQDKDREGSKEILQDAYGLRIGYMDPSRYHRVRVKMRLHKDVDTKGREKPRIELLQILADDWYGVVHEGKTPVVKDK